MSQENSHHFLGKATVKRSLTQASLLENLIFIHLTRELYTEKSVVVTAKLIFVTVKRLAGNERLNEGMSWNQPK